MKKKMIGLFTVLSAIILLILSFSLFVSASSSVVWYQTDPVNKTYKYDKKVSVNTVSEIEAAFENAESNKTLYIVLERDITMDSGMKKFSDWYFIGLYPNTDSSIIFDFNGHSISMSVESGDLSSKLYYGIRIDVGHAKSLTFTDTKGEGGIYFTAYVYDDGPTTALRIIGNDNCVVTFDGGIYSLNTKNGKYQQVFTNGNINGVTPTNWPFSIRDTAFTYTRAAVGLVGGKCAINDGAFRAIIKKTNENEDQRYRYLSAIGLGYRPPDANGKAIPMTQLTINGGMFISERYSVLLTPGDIGKIYRAPVINGGYFCGRDGNGGGICLCSTFLTSYTGFSKDNYSDQFKGYKFSTVVPSSSILLVNGEKKSADSLTFKDLARMDDILVIPFSEGNNKAVDASTGRKITGTIELEVGEKFTVNNVVEDFPNWVTKTGLLISKPSIEVYSTDTGKKTLLGNTKAQGKISTL